MTLVGKIDETPVLDETKLAELLLFTLELLPTVMFVAFEARKRSNNNK